MLPDRQSLTTARRIVVKVGTAVVTRDDGHLALGRLGHLVEQLHALRAECREVLLVSSGAVGLGAEVLGIDRRRATVVDLQACAAAGQGRLMSLYDSLFGRLGIACAQVLLTEVDFHHRSRHVHLAATLQRLLALGAVPVINENDAVSTEELVFARGEVFADNDRLAALVAGALGADALILLSNVDGVLTAPPGEPGAERVSVWSGQDVTLGGRSSVGRGGMVAKIEAARVGARSGVATVIAHGGRPGVLGSILSGDDVGTVFPAATGQRARHAWLAFATVPEGRIEVDEGAREAVVARKASLLPIGVQEVVGTFEAGAVVSLVHAGEEFARGVCTLSAAEADAARLARGRSKALVHRDNLVLLTEDA